MTRQARRASAPSSPPADAPAARDTVHAQVHAAMKRALMRGVFKPGQKITIRGVAAALGTSATPAREAIRRLAGEGALEHLRSGTARLPALDRARLAEITEVRVALESLAARHAAMRMTDARDRGARSDPGRTSQPRATARTMRPTSRTTRRSTSAITARPACRTCMRAIESMWLQAGPYLTLLLPAMRGIDLHAAAIEAARRRDADAASAAIAEDIRRAAKRLASLIPER